MSDSTRIGSSRVGSTPVSTPGYGTIRRPTGVTGAATGDGGFSPAGDIGYRRPNGNAFGPRGNRILPADYPLDQLDSRAVRGTYLDILV